MSGAWVAAAAVVGAAGSYLSAKEGQKVAKEAAKPKETYQVHTPYMNEYISQVSPYILSEAQKVYENRMKGYGFTPGNFTPIGQMLAGIPSNYSGVGKPGSPIMNGGAGTPVGGTNPFSSSYAMKPFTQEQRQKNRAGFRDTSGGMVGNGGDQEQLVNYWNQSWGRGQ